MIAKLRSITVPFRKKGPSEQYRTLAVFKFCQFIDSKSCSKYCSLSGAPKAVLFYPPTYSASVQTIPGRAQYFSTGLSLVIRVVLRDSHGLRGFSTIKTLRTHQIFLYFFNCRHISPPLSEDLHLKPTLFVRGSVELLNAKHNKVVSLSFILQLSSYSYHPSPIRGSSPEADSYNKVTSYSTIDHMTFPVKATDQVA